MSLPVEFIKKYQNLLGEEESNKFFAAIDSSSKKGFRLNRSLKNNYQDVQYSLEEPIDLLAMVIMVKFQVVTARDWWLCLFSRPISNVSSRCT